MKTNTADALYSIQLALSSKNYRGLQRALRAYRSLGWIVFPQLNTSMAKLTAEASRILLSWMSADWNGTPLLIIEVTNATKATS